MALLEAGCDPDKQTIKRRTALKIACEDQDVELVRFLFLNLFFNFNFYYHFSYFILL